MRGALGVRNFRRVFAAQAVSLLGDGLIPVSLAFAVLDDLHGDAGDLGIVLAARLVPLVVLILFGGVIADRVSRRVLMVSMDLVRVVTQGATAALLIAGHAHVWQLVALQMAGGAASAMFLPASTGLLATVVPEEHLQQANSFKGVADAIGTIAGPALAGVLVALAGAGWALAFDAVTFLMSALLLLCITGITAATGERNSFLADLRHGWREFTARRWVWVVVLAASFGNALNAAYYVVGPAWSKAELNGANSWAAIATCAGVGAVTGTVVSFKVRTTHPIRLANLFCLPLAGAPIALALHAPLVLVCVLAVFGGTVIVFNVLWETELQRVVPREALSRVIAYDWMGSISLSPIGSAVGGALGVALGLQASLLAVGILVFVVPAATLAVADVRNN